MAEVKERADFGDFSEQIVSCPSCSWTGTLYAFVKLHKCAVASHAPATAGSDERYKKAGVEFCKCGHLNIEHYGAADWQSNPDCDYICGFKGCECKRFTPEADSPAPSAPATKAGQLVCSKCGYYFEYPGWTPEIPTTCPNDGTALIRREAAPATDPNAVRLLDDLIESKKRTPRGMGICDMNKSVPHAEDKICVNWRPLDECPRCHSKNKHYFGSGCSWWPNAHDSWHDVETEAFKAAPRADKKRPINRPCSACSDGDSQMEYHDHEPPYADEAAPATGKDNVECGWCHRMTDFVVAPPEGKGLCICLPCEDAYLRGRREQQKATETQSGASATQGAREFLADWRSKNITGNTIRLSSPQVAQVMEAYAASQVETLKAERDKWKTMCIVEIAAENQSVADYVKHWEGRAESAERTVTELRARMDTTEKADEVQTAADSAELRRLRAGEGKEGE